MQTETRQTRWVNWTANTILSTGNQLQQSIIWYVLQRQAHLMSYLFPRCLLLWGLKSFHVSVSCISEIIQETSRYYNQSGIFQMSIVGQGTVSATNNLHLTSWSWGQFPVGANIKEFATHWLSHWLLPIIIVWKWGMDN